MPAKIVTVTEAAGIYRAALDGGAKFEVGRRVSYGRVAPTVGLANGRTPGLKFQAEDYAGMGFWVQMLAPTAEAESRRAFNCLNTYDGAYFTFSFLQFGAHVPNGDFVKYFRRVLAEPEAEEYFPDLLLHQGRIARETPQGAVVLETDASTGELMRYLNPSVQAVETAEVVNAAKLIAWTESSARMRALQVEVGVTGLREAMRVYSRRYNLDGRLDKVCLMVADIRHQGRAKSDEILAALGTGGDEEKAYRNLLKIGSGLYQGRLETLEKEVKRLVAAGVLGRRVYRAGVGEFVE